MVFRCFMDLTFILLSPFSFPVFVLLVFFDSPAAE